MSVIVKKATNGDFSNLLPLFKKFELRPTPEEKIKRFFSNFWNADEDYCGYKLEDNGKIVGYLGYFFYKRVIDNEIYKFCNIHGWVVEKEYRNQYKMKVMEPVLDMKDYTIIGLSPTKAAYVNEKRLGFNDLEDTFYIIPAYGSLRGLFDAKIKILNNEDSVYNYSTEVNRKIIDDHKQFKSLHYSISKIDDQEIFFVYSVRRKKRLSFAELHYVSNLDMFLDNLNWLRTSLTFKLHVFGLIIDKRFLKGKIFPSVYEYKYPIPNIYISTLLKPNQIDLLYSEKFVLYH